MTGYMTRSSGDTYYMTFKYTSDGEVAWARSYDGPGSSAGRTDKATAIAVDPAGNVYVTGYSYGGTTASGYDFATLKYSLNGNPMWTNLYNGTGNSTDAATNLVVDAVGNVYVTGSSVGSNTMADYFTIKYNTDGVLLWTNRYSSSGSFGDRATGLAVDTTGNVYVTGVFYCGSALGYGIVTVKYDPNGALAWTNTYNGLGAGIDQPRAIVVNLAGNVYVTGFAATNGNDYVTLKYDFSGRPIWTKTYTGPGNNVDQAAAMAVDGTGNVYVTGVSYGGSSGNDFLTVKYDAGGNQKWVARANGEASTSVDKAYALAVDNAGNVYVAGEAGGDYGIVKYVQFPVYTGCTNLPSGGLRPSGTGGGDETPTPPTIIDDPESQLLFTGEDAYFIVGVGGSPPFAYQWRFNSTNIAGATALDYTVASARPEDAGSYSVIVNNTSGSITSAVARLSVLTASPLIFGPETFVNGEIGFILSADPGYVYIIEMSFDLLDWIPVTAFTNSFGLVQFIMPRPNGPDARFFRAVIVP